MKNECRHTENVQVLTLFMLGCLHSGIIYDKSTLDYEMVWHRTLNQNWLLKGWE